ncbi:F-box protein At5g18160-like [Lolium perenne]|uniref:F-box protein At5g18160-like n=1 Tax=Lolium perenne TaxID=4522 RepID=UPI003A98E6B6
MAATVTVGARPLLPGLPDEIVVWEILLRLPPKYLLRCRAVCCAWRTVTSARDFLLAHHGRQPSLPIFSGDKAWILGVHHHNMLAFDHRAATEDDQLHAIARLDEAFLPLDSCDGMLVLINLARVGSSSCFSICNPATRQHALLGLPWDFSVTGMYLHRPTGEYRLLLQPRWWGKVAPIYHIGFYVFALGSDQPPRYIGWPQTSLGLLGVPVHMRDSLHWCPVYCPSEGNQSLLHERKLVVFDTIAESFRRMREPTGHGTPNLFDMDGTLGIYTCNSSSEAIDIWVLESYESEVWDLKYRIKLPVAIIRKEFQDCGDFWEWDFDVVSVNGGVLLLVMVEEWLLYVDGDGKLVDGDGKLVNRFYRHCRGLSVSECRLKQSLVPHTFFPALEGYAVNASPFIGSVK